jgi:hypothetical protein
MALKKNDRNPYSTVNSTFEQSLRPPLRVVEHLLDVLGLDVLGR